MRLIHRKTINCSDQQSGGLRPRLTSIAVDRHNRLYAACAQEIQRFSPAGELQWRFPTPSASWSIAVDGDSVWVGMRGAIGRFDPQGNLLETIEEKDRLGRITGLAIQGDLRIAADATNHTIHLYRNGEWLREVGGDVNTRGFMIPNGVLDLALDARHRTVLVAHPQKHRVEQYTLDGELTNKFGRFGMKDPADFGGCCNPTNITAAANDLIIVSEKAPPRVKIFTQDGKFLTQSADGIFDSNTKNIDLATDTRGRLYATDPLRCTIEVFLIEATGD